MAFPDPLDRPSRTILTGEGGTGASRTKHVIEQGGRLRRLVPDELDQLQGFPRGWTDTGMSDTRRAFCMGNALVVGVVRRIGEEITRRQNGG
jgi:DNA (cytosine-5)-methyltransferase 1